MSPLLQRELILDRHQAITASRLRVHAASCADAVAELNRLAPAWQIKHTVFVGFNSCALDTAVLDWARPAQVVPEIKASELTTPAVRTLRSECAVHKTPLCLSEVTATASGVLSSFSYALCNTPVPVADLPARQFATSLPDHAAFDAALDAGYVGASGWFFLQPNQQPGAQLNVSHASIIKLLNQVRNNAEVSEIDAAFKQDVALAFKLLRYINSAGFGLRSEIGSFRQAVTMLGYDKLNRWLSLLLVNAGQAASARALMHTALLRARSMEVLGSSKLGKAQADNLFITGAFSVLDVLLGTRMEVLLQHLQLPAEISAALLGQDGPLAPWLKLALACERGSEAELRHQLDVLALTPAQCNDAQLDALAYADKLQFD